MSRVLTHLRSHFRPLPSPLVRVLPIQCESYEQEIARLGGIELFLAGIGEDGHIAFNEPGSSLTSRTRIKTLAYDTIMVNSRFFENKVENVPKHALTVGVGTVMDAREVVVVITGMRKAHALAKCIEEGVNHMWTVSALQLHPRYARGRKAGGASSLFSVSYEDTRCVNVPPSLFSPSLLVRVSLPPLSPSL